MEHHFHSKAKNSMIERYQINSRLGTKEVRKNDIELNPGRQKVLNKLREQHKNEIKSIENKCFESSVRQLTDNETIDCTVYKITKYLNKAP